MKLKNNAKYIIYAAGEAILPGHISAHDVEQNESINALVKQGKAEYIEVQDDGATDEWPIPLPMDKDAEIKSIKAMRNIDKLKEKAAELGVALSDEDDAAAIKEKLVSHIEAL